jgi:hypothetical protein
VVASFELEKTMAPFQSLNTWEKLLVWMRLEADPNSKAGRRARASVVREAESGGKEVGEEGEAAKEGRETGPLSL